MDTLGTFWVVTTIYNLPKIFLNFLDYNYSIKKRHILHISFFMDKPSVIRYNIGKN
jgi:hypothetical protein